MRQKCLVTKWEQMQKPRKFIRRVAISVMESPSGRGKMGFPSPCYVRDRQRSNVFVVPSYFSNCFWHGLNPLGSIKRTVWRNWEMFPLPISQRNQNYFSLTPHPQAKAPLITVMCLFVSSPTKQHFRVCGVFYATKIQVQDESFCSWKQYWGLYFTNGLLTLSQYFTIYIFFKLIHRRNQNECANRKMRNIKWEILSLFKLTLSLHVEYRKIREGLSKTWRQEY